MQNIEGQYSFSSTKSLGAKWKASRQDALFKHFLPILSRDSLVVEAGPGRGEFSRACVSRGLRFTGIEPSETLAESLRQEGFDIIQDTIPPMPLNSDSVDLVHSADFVEHLVDYREVMAFFKESFRVLKPGGYISVIAPNYETIRTLYFKYEYQHSFIVTRHRIGNALEDCGFEIVNSRSFLISPAPWKNIMDRILVHTAVPVLTNAWVQALIRMLANEDILFRINKNLYDHVAVLARKPAAE